MSTDQAAPSTCGSCGSPLERVGGGAMFLCGGPAGGQATTLPPILRCPDIECRRAAQEKRDADAIAWAVEKGLIDP